MTDHEACSIKAASPWPDSSSKPKGVVVLLVKPQKQPSSLALSKFAAFASYQSLFCCIPIKKKSRIYFFNGVDPSCQSKNQLYKRCVMHTHLSGGGTEPSKALQGADETFPGSG